MSWWIAVLIGWVVFGLLGWGWANYSAYAADGPSTDNEPEKWKALKVAPFAGPLMIAANVKVSMDVGKFYWGLRFK